LKFPKSARLLKPAEFRKVYQNGIRISGPLFSAFCLQAERATAQPGPRLGFTTPRAFGRAVERNRARRRIREALRVRLDFLASNWDLVINPKRAVLHATHEELVREVERLLSRCEPR
jgi:ribonuclease P protein component